MFHRSWGLMLIQANIDAPCTLLDFPTLERFVEELRTTRYDIVGISGILANVGKVEKMCELVRAATSPRRRSSSAATSPTSPTSPSGSTPTTSCAGEGVRWFRAFLGEDAGPADPASADRRRRSGRRILGVRLPDRRRATWPRR